MSEISDDVLAHLRSVTEEPDLGVPRFRLLGEIGRGGMGTVYLALDRELDRTVAIKVVHEHELESSAADRLKSEARILARLEHPGIVPVYDAGLGADGRPFYVMKYVAGRRLDEVVRDGASLQEKLRVFGRICEAVESAHAQRVIHRDLKPANVRVGFFGEVLVLDFGLAKILRRPSERALVQAPARELGLDAPLALAPGQHSTTQGTIAGTPGYMAPEQARGDVDAVDERSDVYALGAILEFLLDESSPAPLKAIAAKAKSNEPSSRYASVSALSDDLNRFHARLAVSAYREGLPARLARVATRYQTPLLLVAAYLVLRMLILFFSSS